MGKEISSSDQLPVICQMGKAMTSGHFYRKYLAFAAFLVASCWDARILGAAQANFWIANNDNGPQAPLIEVLEGSFNSFDIWARPEPGSTLAGFSLNLRSTNSTAIAFTSVEVINPTQTSGNAKRHQIVFDSSVTWQGTDYDDEGEPVVVNHSFNEDHLQFDFIESFLGATFVNGSDLESDGAGIGPECSDNQCMSINGHPAWKVATVDFTASDSSGSTLLFLEIGEQGVWHVGDTTSSTSVLFGDPADGDPEDIHSWTPATTGMQEQGLPDAVIHVVSQFSDADFDVSGLVDGEDFLIWQRGYGDGGEHNQGNANLDQAIDQTDLQIWQAQYGTVTAPLMAVPEPTAIVLQIGSLLLAAAAISRASVKSSALRESERRSPSLEQSRHQREHDQRQ